LPASTSWAISPNRGHTLRRLEHELTANPHIADAVLTIAEPDDPAADH
jgi:hypothetical protein